MAHDDVQQRRKDFRDRALPASIYVGVYQNPYLNGGWVARRVFDGKVYRKLFQGPDAEMQAASQSDEYARLHGPPGIPMNFARDGEVKSETLPLAIELVEGVPVGAADCCTTCRAGELPVRLLNRTALWIHQTGRGTVCSASDLWERARS